MSEAETQRTSPKELADLPDDFWTEAELLWPGRKDAISLRVDDEILDWFRKSGPRYQSRMNAVLRSYVAVMRDREANAHGRSRRQVSEASPTAPISEQLMRRIIVGSEPEVAEQYQRHFRAETDLAIKILAEAYSEFQRLGRQVAQEPRCATVQLFVHVSINSVVTSMHHLVHGYPIASGNMMRHFTEAIAMAMLCADERTGVYARYEANRAHFDVDSASDLLTRKVNKKFLTQSLGFDSDAWSTVRKQVKLYNKLSHASGPALGYQFLFDVTGGLVLGAAFDPAKVDYYRSDLVRRRTAAAALKQVVPIILAALPRRSETGA